MLESLNFLGLAVEDESFKDVNMEIRIRSPKEEGSSGSRQILLQEKQKVFTRDSKTS